MLALENESLVSVIFFFQAEDGIRDLTVTGVQTCALPISSGRGVRFLGADQNLSAFCQAEAFYRSMNSSPDQSDLFPGFVPAPQMVFVNDRVSFQTEAKQRVILVHGVAYSHYSLEDRIAEAYALVKLYESGYADQNDLARAFGYSTRTLRRFQQRLHRGGLNALIRPQGRPAEDSRSEEHTNSSHSQI